MFLKYCWQFRTLHLNIQRIQCQKIYTISLSLFQGRWKMVCLFLNDVWKGSIIVCLFLLSSKNNKCCHPCSLCYDFEIFFLRNCFLIVGHLSSIGHGKVLCTPTQIKQAYLVKWWKIINSKISSKLMLGTPQNLSRLSNVEIFCNMFPLKITKLKYG